MSFLEFRCGILKLIIFVKVTSNSSVKGNREMVKKYQDPLHITSEEVPDIRLLPMSKNDLAFIGKSIEEVQDWFRFYLPGNTYQFKRKMTAPKGTLVLFQFQGRLIASALLKKTVSYDEVNEFGYSGYYKFSKRSIFTFDPLDIKDVQKIWSGMKGFHQSHQKLDAAQYPALKQLLAKRQFRLVKFKNDEDYQKAIEEITLKKAVVEDKPKELIEKESKASKKMQWRRAPLTAKKAIVQAEYKCEWDAGHEFFVSSVTGENYVEAHHLIPLEFQREFENSLDVEANIVSLCAMCHKKIHHAQGSEKFPMVEMLYEKRSERLKKCGIDIEVEELLKSY
ncbi:MAG TPA: HNH endonuclease [Planococcus sp. (in: firmicutes)]|nr:HNH endonuclease [Planococcus sp. (in: firmicutes)]